MLSKTIKQLPTRYSYIMFNRRIEIYISEDTYQYAVPVDDYNQFPFYRFLYRYNREIITNKNPYTIIKSILFKRDAQIIYTDSHVNDYYKVKQHISIFKNAGTINDHIAIIEHNITNVFKSLDTDSPIHIHNKIPITIVSPIVTIKYSKYVI